MKIEDQRDWFMHKQFEYLLKNRVKFERNKKEEIIFEDQILELFVIFQVQLFVSSIFCNHLADQKYP